MIDCPDLPLNVSRSALQNDGFVKKISDYISKKVADKLSGMCKTEKEEYDKYWDDISPFIKFGCLKDDKFCEKMTDYILFKNLDGKYLTLPECLDVNKTDAQETDGAAEGSKEETAKTGEDGNKEEGTVAEDGSKEPEAASEDGNEAKAVDEDGNKVEAEVVNADGSSASDDEDIEDGEEEKKEKVIYYVTDEQQQSQYINMFKSAKMDAVILTHNIDQPFISQLEAKNEGIKFQRIDADLTDSFKTKNFQEGSKGDGRAGGRDCEDYEESLEKGQSVREGGNAEKQTDFFHDYRFRGKQAYAGYDEDVRGKRHGYGIWAGRGNPCPECEPSIGRIRFGSQRRG